ncbi:MAG: PAS domain S-box protein [Pontiellaceae bacterium]|nr:PAS domain S-box protein [Pontiellaceae bacterium]MBN2783753.1 PAS domain S-box protein [Pontiellaceae bacterium]
MFNSCTPDRLTAFAMADAAGAKDILTPMAVVLFLLSIILFALLMRARKRMGALTDELEKSSNSLRALDENLTNVAMFQLAHKRDSDEFEFLFISERIGRIMGIDSRRLMEDPRSGLDIIFEEDLARLKEAFTNALKEQKAASMEIRALDASGSYRWLHISALPVQEPDRCIWHGFAEDVSMVKEAEIMMDEEGRKFEYLFESIDDFLVVCDMEGQFLHTNAAFQKRLDYSKDELKEMSIFQVYQPDDQPSIFEVVARLQNIHTETCDLPLRMESGAGIPVRMNFFRGSWERQPAIFGVARDVADYERTETALRESRKMLQLIIDTIPMSIFWKDKDSIYLGCNRTFIQECQLQQIDNVVGKTPFDLFDTTIAPDIVERDQSVIQTNKPLMNYSESHTRPDGSLGRREISLIPLKDAQGGAVGVLGVWRDVTEQNRAEERLKRTLDDMERFNQLMRGRERRTLELKAEINELLSELGKPKKYRTTTDDLL